MGRLDFCSLREGNPADPFVSHIPIPGATQGPYGAVGAVRDAREVRAVARRLCPWSIRARSVFGWSARGVDQGVQGVGDGLVPVVCW